MTKIKYFALMSAIALTSAVGLTACSSSDEVAAEPNPTYDGESVKTQFTISFPQNVAKTTRMGANEVQATATIAKFRGMDNITLIPFGINTAVSATDKRIGAPIDLATQIKPAASSATNSINASNLLEGSNSVLYQDVQIPIGTGAFLFYGKAIDNAANTKITTIADKYKFGTLTPSDALSSANNTVPTDITFTPVAIKETVSGLGNGTAGDIAAYLTNIAKANGWSTETSNNALKQLYSRFISMKAGSSQAVADLIGDLLWALRGNTSDVANAIRAEIYHSQTPNTDGSLTAGNPADDYIKSVAVGTGTFEITLGDKCAGYPANNNLPEGAAQIAWNSNASKFDVTSTDIPTATSGNMNVAALSNYVYPANLQYYVNSPAMVSQASQADKFNGTNSWDQILTNYTQGYVGVPTRSVVIKDPIQYGVGQLKITVRTAADVLKDNSDQDDTAPTADVTVPEAGITVKGLLMGGQRAVDWEFLPQKESSLYTIYDNAIPSGFTASKGTWSGAYNYTLALETPVQEKVYVALELVNNTGQTFYGQNNQKILPNRTFYLVGEVDPTKPAASGTKTYSRDHKAYTTSGTEETKAKGATIDQVIVQDYVTTLNLTIQDLRKALNTIPDLRMPNMEFGLSVDLTWEEGNYYNVDL